MKREKHDNKSSKFRATAPQSNSLQCREVHLSVSQPMQASRTWRGIDCKNCIAEEIPMYYYFTSCSMHSTV